MTEATVGFSTQGAVYGFKLHALKATRGFIVRFAITPAHEADVRVARALLDEQERSVTLGDKAYIGCGIYTPPKTNALNPNIWTRLMDKARQTIESVFSSLTRTKHIVVGQRNSFRSILDLTSAVRLLLTISLVSSFLDTSSLSSRGYFSSLC